MSSLDLEVVDPARGVDLAFVARSGRTTALLGPNGAGKSTVLASIAGVHRPARLRLSLDGRERHQLPTHRRRIALLSQDPLLLPHVSVLDNVGLGPRCRGQSRREARATARGWLDRVGALALGDRPAGELSGGQAQRVAIARALAAEPDALLLDEPLSALDVDAAPTVREVLREVLIGRTAIIVSHDLIDAALLAQDAVVLDGGRVVEQRPVGELLGAPRSRYGARLAGVNLVTGTMHGAAAVLPADGPLLRGSLHGRAADGDAVSATFRPEQVALHPASSPPPATDDGTVLAATVLSLEPSGSLVRVRLASRLGDLLADLSPGALGEARLAPGEPVQLSIPAAAVRIEPAGASG